MNIKLPPRERAQEDLKSSSLADRLRGYTQLEQGKEKGEAKGLDRPTDPNWYIDRSSTIALPQKDERGIGLQGNAASIGLPKRDDLTRDLRQDEPEVKRRSFGLSR